MDSNKIIKFGLIAGAGYFIWKEFNNAKELSSSLVFSPENVSLDTTHVFAPILKLTVQITNPSPNNVVLSKIFATVLLDSNQIGTINNEQSVTIAGTATTHITLNITLNSIDVLTTLINIDWSNLDTIKLNIQGYYVANLIRLPLNLTFGKKIGLAPYRLKWPRKSVLTLNDIQTNFYIINPNKTDDNISLQLDGFTRTDIINKINLYVSIGGVGTKYTLPINGLIKRINENSVKIILKWNNEAIVERDTVLNGSIIINNQEYYIKWSIKIKTPIYKKK